MTKIPKTNQYALIIQGKLQELFNEDGNYQIDKEEFSEGDNLTHFVHALANIVPTCFFNKITGEDKDYLQFNHLANNLVFQYCNIKEDEDE